MVRVPPALVAQGVAFQDLPLARGERALGLRHELDAVDERPFEPGLCPRAAGIVALIEGLFVHAGIQPAGDIGIPGDTPDLARRPVPPCGVTMCGRRLRRPGHRHPSRRWPGEPLRAGRKKCCRACVRRRRRRHASMRGRHRGRPRDPISASWPATTADQRATAECRLSRWPRRRPGPQRSPPLSLR